MDKKGQIWVETVIYTLIGLTIIGLVLASALPKINERKDSISIEQSIDALKAIDGKIYEVQAARGNRRVVDLEIRKGLMIIDMENDEISWVLDSSFAYSEVGLNISLGRLNVTTMENSGSFKVELISGYNVDIRFGNETVGTKAINSAPTLYNLIIENSGVSDDGRIIVDLRVA